MHVARLTATGAIVVVWLMTWDELRKFLEAEDEKNKPGEEARIESLRASSEPAAERRARRLDVEYAARTVVSQACWHFATTGRWPAMDAEATLYAHDRWIWAMWFSRYLDENGSLTAEQDQDEWLVWLLVESWDELGSWRWRESQRAR